MEVKSAEKNVTKLCSDFFQMEGKKTFKNPLRRNYFQGLPSQEI